MKYVLTAQEMKRADQYTMEHFRMLSAVLMERAALRLACEAKAYLNGLADRKKSDSGRFLNGSVLVVCGSGNNGGDGFAAARLLLLWGIRAEVWFVGNRERMSEECRRQRDIFLAYHGNIYDTNPEMEYSIIIDAVFGVGLGRKVEGSYADVIEAMNLRSGHKIAADIPSGISADDGQVLGTAFAADVTVTFGFYKKGLLLYPGRKYAGRVVLDDVGITEHSLQSFWGRMLEKEDIRHLLPVRCASGHKGSYGKVLVIAGSESMCGAACFAAKAAYMTGAGLVKIYTHRANRNVLAGLLPEALISVYESYEPEQLERELHWADAVILGPGLSKCKISVNLVKDTLYHCTKVCIIDADALNILAEHPEFAAEGSCQRIATPHMMEMARLTGQSVQEVAGAREEAMDAVLQNLADVCVLKDAATCISSREGGRYINTSGNSALSKGGSGDILTGVIAGLLVQGLSPASAAALGVYLHGLAGERMSEQKGYYSVLASDLLDGLAKLLNEYGDER